jgi:glycosyltransferase involved in cell wall biosynthesis
VRDIFIQNISELYFKRKFILYNPIIKFLNFIEIKIYKEANLNIISPGFSFFIRSKSDKFSIFTHGIPEIFYDNYFNKNNNSIQNWTNKFNTIVYAGNIGEGQGLHLLIPEFAKLNKNFHIKILGNGNYKNLLLEKSKKLNLNNVEILNQVKQEDLIKIYNEADFLLLNLNDYKVFKFVVPSKIFEYATFNKPILCGAAGITKRFINNNIPNVYFFKPNNAIDLANTLLELDQNLFINRDNFIKKFKYTNIIDNYMKSLLDDNNG